MIENIKSEISYDVDYKEWNDDLSKKSGVQWARIQKIERNNDISADVDDKLISIRLLHKKNVNLLHFQQKKI